MCDLFKNGEGLAYLLGTFFLHSGEKFNRLKTNKQRLDFMQTAIRDTTCKFLEDKKNDQVAVKLREQGNISFQKGEFIKALKTYTESLAKAKNKTFKSLAYANRSAVLSKLNLHRECLLDIDRAFENDYPENLKAKLIARRQNSAELQKHQKKPLQVTKIDSSQKNESIQSASDCVKIAMDKQYGRHIVATRDIKIGELVAVEEPYTCMLIDEYMIYCHECATLCYCLIPCDGCTRALYCSQLCKDKAYSNHHKYECAILLSIMGLTSVTATIAFALKLTFIATMEYTESGSNSNDLTYRSDRYKEISNLLSHADTRPSNTSFAMTFLSVVVYNFVKAQTSYFIDYKNSEETFKELLLMNLQIIDVNAVTIGRSERKLPVGKELNGYGWGIYSFYSLFNHSCCSNVFFYHHGATIILRANSTIRQGEQCFISYGFHYNCIPKAERQSILRDKYFFNCTCLACQENWPDNLELDGFQSLCYDTIYTRFFMHDLKFADEILPRLFRKLQAIEASAPSAEINFIQQLLTDYYQIFETSQEI